VIDVTKRAYGNEAEVVEERIRWLIAGGLEVVPDDELLATSAGELRAQQYHGATAPVSIADCFALAAAIALGDRLATADRALARVARQAGIQVVALPDSSGHRPK